LAAIACSFAVEFYLQSTFRAVVCDEGANCAGFSPPFTGG
jgi:hypothetical protein